VHAVFSVARVIPHSGLWAVWECVSLLIAGKRSDGCGIRMVGAPYDSSTEDHSS
jgi:hypothetical protein